MVNLYAKIKCYKCEEVMLGREIIKGSSIGSGFFMNYVCEGCTRKDYVWACGDDLVTEFEREKLKNERAINKIILELGGILSL